MPPSPLPQRFVLTPPQILYDLSIPPEIRDTYNQLLGLAWSSNKKPPEFTLKRDEVSLITGKSRSTLYGHLAFLRDRGVLRYSTAKDGSLNATMLVYVDKSGENDQSSNILDGVSLNPSDQLTGSVGEEEKRDSVQNIGRLQARAHPGKQTAPAIPIEIIRPLVDILAAVTQMDKTLNYPRLAKTARELHLAGYTHQQVHDVYGEGGKWYLCDWRGQKGNLPDLGSIKPTIKALLGAKIPVNNTNGPKTAPANGLAAEIARRKARLANGNGSGSTGSV